MLLLACTAVAMMTIDARGGGPFQSARATAYGVTQPVRSAVGWVLSPVADIWQGAVHYDDLARENDELRQRVAELEGRVDGLPDVQGELDELRLATGVDFVERYPLVVARVSSDRRTSVERIIEIDRGTSDGIFENMPVVTGEGLVGLVILATGDRAQIRLISDPRLNVGVVSKGTRAIGVSTGDGDGADLILDLEEGAEAVVNEDARFESSGLEGSRYPGGIPVGQLTIVDGAPKLVPFADLERLAFVSVILVTDSAP